MTELAKPKQFSNDFKRDYTLDNYRGFVIFILFLWCCMFLGLPGFSWIKHTDSYAAHMGFGIMDYGMIMFALASGLTYSLAFKRQKEKLGSKGAYAHFMRRNLAVMGVGAIDLVFKMIGDGCIDKPYGWEVFCSLGFASIFALIFIDKSKLTRIIASLGIFVVYALMYLFVPLIQSTFFIKLPYGGPFGAIGLAGLILLFSVFGDLYRENKKKFLLGCLVMVLLAIPCLLISLKSPMFNVTGNDMLYGVNFYTNLTVLEQIFSISFTHMTIGFLIFGGALSLLTFLPIMLISMLIKKEIPFIATMGKNTIVFFFLFAITSLFTGMIQGALGAPWGVVVNAIVVIIITFSIAYWFKKKNIIIKA